MNKPWLSLKNRWQEENLSGELRVIGDRGSGKTTYMAALARWPNTNPDSPVETVTPANRDGENLIKQARNKLEQGLPLPPTQLRNDVLEIKDYSLRIALKRSMGKQLQKTVNLDISCKDYPGEFFSDLLHQQMGSPLLQNYIDDCLLASGILLLVDGNANDRDKVSQYALGIERLRVAMERSQTERKRRRIALVLTKCELPDLYINRDRPRYLAEARFDKVVQRLEAWQSSGAVSIDYFRASAFGMLGGSDRGNSKQIRRDRNGVASALQDPTKWRPFGLVSPIYWLCTGKRHPQLD